MVDELKAESMDAVVTAVEKYPGNYDELLSNCEYSNVIFKYQ